MNLETVHSLFTLFSGEEDSHAFAPIITASVKEVQGMIQEEADQTDVRLCYLAGAVANLRYTQIYGARNSPLATFAGNVSKLSDNSQKLAFAERLVRAYQRLCGDLLKNQDFVFFTVGGADCECHS